MDTNTARKSPIAANIAASNAAAAAIAAGAWPNTANPRRGFALPPGTSMVMLMAAKQTGRPVVWVGCAPTTPAAVWAEFVNALGFAESFRRDMIAFRSAFNTELSDAKLALIQTLAAKHRANGVHVAVMNPDLTETRY